MFLQDLLKICLVVLDGFGGIFTGLIQGDLIKCCSFSSIVITFHLPIVVTVYFVHSSYNFNPIASFTYEVIKSGLRPVPCLSGISMISGVL